MLDFYVFNVQSMNIHLIQHRENYANVTFTVSMQTLLFTTAHLARLPLFLP